MYILDFNAPCHVHFIGIGGISMSGLAEILLERGFEVSGSDNTPSDIIDRLSERGAKIYIPQSGDNIKGGTDLVVYTAAIHPDNPEYMACERMGIPMLSRAAFLGQLMRQYKLSVAVAGTHGKTTTTGMIGEILLEAARDGEGSLRDGRKPTISIGGVLPSIESNIFVGDSDIFLTEACEYTNSFHEFYPKYNVILNIEEDHMDFFKDLSDIQRSFRRFAENTADDGVLVLGEGLSDQKELVEGLSCRVINIGKDYYAKNTRVKAGEDGKSHTVFDAVENGTDIGEVWLSVPGAHNVGNALCAIAIAREMGISLSAILNGLKKFGGAKRRFEYRGKVNGALLYDDYAHHPTEIAATIAAARMLPHKRLVIVFQPHTYTRTKAFLEEFAEVLKKADIVGLCPVYPAREEDIYGVHSEDICDLINKRIAENDPGCAAKECYNFSSFDEAEKFLKKISSTGDLLITMGAGDVVKIADSLSEG